MPVIHSWIEKRRVKREREKKELGGKRGGEKKKVYVKTPTAPIQSQQMMLAQRKNRQLLLAGPPANRAHQRGRCA